MQAEHWKGLVSEYKKQDVATIAYRSEMKLVAEQLLQSPTVTAIKDTDCKVGKVA